MELVTKKKLHLVSGRANYLLAEEIAAALDVQQGEANHQLRQRRDPLPLR